MSLINDALKRASQSERNRPRETNLPAAMQAAPEARRSFVPAAAGVAIVVLLAAAGWMIWRALPHRQSTAPLPAVASAKESAAAIATPPQTNTPAPPAKMEPAPPPAVAPAKESAPVAATPPPPPPPAPAVAPQPPPFPELKLQGIFYSPNNPRAAINGQVYRENELVGEVRLVTITANKVTVEWNGQTKDLNLEGQ
jgi:hypothetical protein